MKEQITHLLADEKVEKFSDMKGIFFLLRLSRENYHRLMGAILILVCSVICLMFSVHIIGKLFQALSSDLRWEAVWHMALLFLTLEILAATLRYYGSVFAVRTTNNIIYETRKKLFVKLTRLPITYYDTQPMGRTLSRLTTDVEGVEHFFSQIMPSSLCCILELALIAVSMLLIDFKFGIIVLAISMPTFAFAVIFRNPLKFWLRIHKKLNALVLSCFAEFANAFEVIKSFSLGSWSRGKFKDLNAKNYQVHLRIQHWNAFVRPTIVLLCSFPVIFVLLVGGRMVLDNALELAVFVSFVRFCVHVQAPIRALSHDIQIIQDAITSAERIRQTFIEIEEAYPLGVIEDKKPGGDIKFKRVCLDYLRDKQVLDSISFHAQPGMKVGLVGETGAGKTSTVNLIPSLYNYSQGEILLDDIPIREWSKACVRKNIGYVNQDVIIFQGTLRENIVCGFKVTDEEIYKLAENLGFGNNLRQLVLGHRVMAHGQNLSAGERQVIAFMRMMLKKPHILILDEATANIDHGYEELMHRALFEVMADKTCFIIAHRLSTVRKCDQILVFRNGKIIEKGTHNSLEKNAEGYYRYLLEALDS